MAPNAPIAPTAAYTGSRYGFTYTASTKEDYDSLQITYDEKRKIYTFSGKNVSVCMPSGDFNIFVSGSGMTVKDLGVKDTTPDYVYLAGERNEYDADGKNDQIYIDGKTNLARLQGADHTVTFEKGAKLPLVDATKTSRASIKNEQTSGGQSIIVSGADSKDVAQVKKNLITGFIEGFLTMGVTYNSVKILKTTDPQVILDTIKQTKAIGSENTFGQIVGDYQLPENALSNANNIYLKDGYEIEANGTDDLDGCRPTRFDRDYTKLVIPIDKSKYFTTKP